LTEHRTTPLVVTRADPRTLHDLRRRVLRGGDPDSVVDDPRDDEPTSRHYGGYLDETLVVCASYYRSRAPVNTELVSAQLRYMATDVDFQGCGYGARVLDAAEVDLREGGVEQLWAYGRDSALGFYRSVGWSTVEGSEHLSAETGLPHTTILKLLSPRNS
jgi:hypothetical protein